MKDRIVEMTLVVKLNRRLDEDLELLVRDYLESEGLLEVRALTRVGLTGTIDLPRVWLPTSPETVSALRSTEEAELWPLPVPLPAPPSPPKKRPITGWFKAEKPTKPIKK